ncbi:MAG: hypothetical protein K0Q76_278, partial [Panacagrimonas sp.]|nr:hypothetical protein [Panacagrimonas sp.]
QLAEPDPAAYRRVKQALFKTQVAARDG